MKEHSEMNGPASEEGLITVFAADSDFKGDFAAPGDVRVFGNFEGKLTCREVTIEKAGSIDGDVSCESISIAGTMRGTSRSENLLVHASGCIEGEFWAASTGIEPGAAIRNASITGPDDEEMSARNSSSARMRRLGAPASERGSVALPRKSEETSEKTDSKATAKAD